MGLMPLGAAAAPGLSLHATKAKVLSGTGTVLSGRVTGAPPHSSVSVVERAFPYTHPEVTTAPVKNGRFTVRFAPLLNSKYRAILRSAGERTKSRLVYVRVLLPFSAEHFDVSSRPKHRAIARYSYQFPAGYPLPLGGRRVSWYFREANNPIYRRIAVTRSTERSDRLEAVLNFRLPGGNYGYFYSTACFDFGRPFGRDLGVGYPEHRYCPQRFRDKSP